MIKSIVAATVAFALSSAIAQDKEIKIGVIFDQENAHRGLGNRKRCRS